MNEHIKLPLDKIAIKRIDKYPNKPTIIFLHDSLGCIELWRDFPEKLGELTQCNVLIYDRQGYGESCSFSDSKRDNKYLELEADILNTLIDYWKLKEVLLFGHSDGGSIALILAGKYPNKIKGIVTEGAHIFVEDLTINGIQKVIELYKTTNLKSKLTKYHGNKTEEMFWAWAATWTTNDYKYWNIEQFIPNIKCPSFIIQGENDEYGTLKQVNRIINATKGSSRALILPNIKHSPHKEVPQLVLEKTAYFIKQLDF
ncbi:MAG: alpha/beta hydrolase [Flavobacteriaceae bacterium]|nr:alpha/beta hydrolase [Flavobacteriaceae bacterium]